jgi:hypothetical protein
MTLGRMKASRWQHERLPDFLWLQAIRQETGDLSTANEALDILDLYVPELSDDLPSASVESPSGEPPPRPIDHLDGRLSSFSLVPEAQHSLASEALSAQATWALPDELGHALALYPECPAAWLYESWARTHRPDPEIGLPYLKRLVAAIYDPRGRRSSQLRMIPVARMFAHDKLHLRQGMEIIDLLPRYPTGLDTEGQLRVEQWARTASLAFSATEDTTVADRWVAYFWRHSYDVSPCEPAPRSVPAQDDDEAEDERIEASAGDASPPLPLGQVRDEFLAAVDELGQALQALQRQAPIDTYEPTADEVKLGLASRQFRLLRRFVADPHLWTNEMAPHLVRSMVDIRIVASWLMKQEGDELFVRFKAYGQGKRKLLKLKLEDLMERQDISFDDADEDFLARLREQVNQDTMEEFQTIDVGGNFSGKNIREMAAETDLADLYSLTYQPLSTEAHGEWGSLIDFDLVHCGNPLHKYHRVGRFDTAASQRVYLGWIRDAFLIARDTIEEILAGYELDSEPLSRRAWRGWRRYERRLRRWLGVDPVLGHFDLGVDAGVFVEEVEQAASVD